MEKETTFLAAAFVKRRLLPVITAYKSYMDVLHRQKPFICRLYCILLQRIIAAVLPIVVQRTKRSEQILAGAFLQLRWRCRTCLVVLFKRQVPLPFMLYPHKQRLHPTALHGESREALAGSLPILVPWESYSEVNILKNI